MRPPRPAKKPRKRVLCPLCEIDVAISAAGKLSKHAVVLVPTMKRVWCPVGGTIPNPAPRPLPD